MFFKEQPAVFKESDEAELHLPLHIDRTKPPLTVPPMASVEDRITWACKERQVSISELELLEAPDLDGRKVKVIDRHPTGLLTFIQRAHCRLCKASFNDDRRTVYRHLRTKVHLHNVANFLWLEPDTLQDEDTEIECGRCGHK